MARDARRAIGIFFKPPAPGRVKTRLCPPLTPDQAARLYDAFLRDTIGICRRVESAEVILFEAGDSSSWNPPWASDLPRIRQDGADLGDRLARAVEVLLARGAQKVVIVGSDSPALPPEHLESAFNALDHLDLVLGPTQDGGFYLVGMLRPPGRLFEGIRWSTPEVRKETEARALSLGLRCGWTHPWSDVDTPQDLLRLRDLLAREDGGVDPDAAGATREMLRILEDSLKGQGH